MLARLRGRLTFANVVSAIALFVALGGGAYAMTLPRNSVGAAQIRRNAVRSSEIKRGAVRSSDVRDASLLAKDFAAGQLPAGPRGLTGPIGPRGLTGATGPAGATHVVVRTQLACGTTLPPNVHCGFDVQCHAGERATGGGAGFTDFGGDEVLLVSQPATASGANPVDGAVPTGWVSAIKYTTGTGPRTPIGYVVCASP